MGKSNRDPNKPVAAWELGGTIYEVRYTGPGEYCDAPFRPGEKWGGKTPSLILTTQSVNGIRDEEMDPYNPAFWGWITRLIAEKHDVTPLLGTDKDIMLGRET